MKKIFVLVALLVAIVGAAAAQWRFMDDVDPMTDYASYYAYVKSTDGQRSFVMRVTNGVFEIYVVWHEYMIVDETHTLLVRFDSLPAIEINANRATDGKASFFWADTITEHIPSGPKRMIVRITERGGQQTTATFDTTGIIEAALTILKK